MSCQLCMLEHDTYVYQDNDKFIILDCKDCNVPMAVWKTHTMQISDKDADEMETHLKYKDFRVPLIVDHSVGNNWGESY